MHPLHPHTPMIWDYFMYILCMSFLSCVLAYLIGSIPFGLLLGKAFGAGDIRKIGSGNIGATNMLRTGKKGLAAATLLLDGLKGTFAVWLCHRDIFGMDYHKFIPTPPLPIAHGSLQFHQEVTLASPLYLYFCAIAAVLGHIYPIWLNFKGGKGVATTLGVYFALQPLVGLITVIIWLITFILTKYSSLAAITSIALSPLVGLFICHDAPFAVTALALAIIVIAKHKDNIIRLRAGTESSWRKA